MASQLQHTIYTIGHSTHSMEFFVEMLQSFNISLLADVRRFPGSKKYPQFSQENLKRILPQQGINYQHFEELGGRRKVQKDSKNTTWRNASFQGYADYMETGPFISAADALELVAAKQATAIMCSEAVWWRCHRSMISDYLKAKGWAVWHIMGVSKAQEHPFTAPAIVHGTTVSYTEENHSA